ncbi:MAG: glycosyltransferase family 4 protein [Minwuia sp.]|nr:glycosyltransferase family 4 protein [Minwuia sp.]
MTRTRLAIVSSHPIQYNAPLFQELARNSPLEIRLFYCWEGPGGTIDREFGRQVIWDIPLLDGYDWEIVPNVSADPGTHHFNGLNNPEMVDRISRWQPDAVLVYGWAWRTNLRVLRHFHGQTPILFRGDSTLASVRGPRLKRWLRRPVLRWVYSHVDIALTPGTRNSEYLRHMGLPMDRISHMPHSIDTERFGTTSGAVPNLRNHERAQLGIGEHDPVFLYAGKFVSHKRVDTLIDAFRKVANAVPGAHLVLAGDGAGKTALDAQARDLSNVHFPGFRNQSAMPGLYQMADVFVLPSSSETWGLSVNEALTAGCMAIASDQVGCAPDLLADTTYGRIFPCGDVDTLARIMISIAEDPAALYLNGRQAAKASSNWSTYAASTALQSAIAKLVLH